MTEEALPAISLHVAKVLKAGLALKRENGKLQEAVNRAWDRGARFGGSVWTGKPTLVFGPCHGIESRLHLWKRAMESEGWLQA